LQCGIKQDSLRCCCVDMFECVYFVMDHSGKSQNDIDHTWGRKCESDNFRHQMVASTPVFQGLMSTEDMGASYCKWLIKTCRLRSLMRTTPHHALPRLSLVLMQGLIGAAICLGVTRQPRTPHAAEGNVLFTGQRCFQGNMFARGMEAQLRT
jgi:hypothetical protein